MATVWAAGAVVALLAVAGLLLAMGGVLVTRQRAASAADLAALTAAGHAGQGSREACARAARLADRMSVRMRDCWFEQWDALVIVEAGVPGALARLGPVVARARAGPAEPSALPATSGRAGTS